MSEINVYNGSIHIINKNVLMCGDIENEDCYKKINIPQNIYMVYSDPPWNPGNARMWRTLSKKDGDIGRKVNWNNFVERLCTHILYTNPKHIFIEMGLQKTSDFIKQGQSLGFPPIQNIWKVFYNYKNPYNLLYFSEINEFKGNPEGMKNEYTTKHVFEYISKPGEIVFDPCIGLGMTLRMAHKFGMSCYGIELNPERLQKTISWIIKRTNEQI